MAKLKALPEQTIIDGFKGVIDFYYWRGIPCARSWPQPPTEPRSLPVQQTYTAFADYARRVIHTDPTIISASFSAAAGQPWTWKDLITSAAYGKLIFWT